MNSPPRDGRRFPARWMRPTGPPPDGVADNPSRRHTPQAFAPARGQPPGTVSRTGPLEALARGHIVHRSMNKGHPRPREQCDSSKRFMTQTLNLLAQPRAKLLNAQTFFSIRKKGSAVHGWSPPWCDKHGEFCIPVIGIEALYHQKFRMLLSYILKKEILCFVMRF